MYNSIEDLKKEISTKLEGYLSDNCVLLNAPDHVNIGDQLIWQGEMDYLASNGIKPSYICSLFSFDWRSFSEDTLIMLHGGGNFGDFWEYHQDFRMKVIKKYKNNQILIFPQSVHYTSVSKLKSDASIFAKHSNLIICARDKHSYDLLTKFFDNTIIMVPDMAFSTTYKKHEKDTDTKKILLLKRTDKELPSQIDFNRYENLNIHDWPSFDNTPLNLINRIWEKVNREATNVLFKHLGKRTKRDTTFGFGVIRDKDYLVNLGVKFLSEYDLIVTTRLHGHILALLLGIPSIMIDNSYGKNSRFYNTWLKEIPKNTIVSNNDELDKALRDFLTNIKA